MKMDKLNSLFVCLLSICLITTSCTEDDETTQFTDNFDRSAMLSFWADNIIIPAFMYYDVVLDDLVGAKDAFLADKSDNTLADLRTSWLNAYKAWQYVSMFDIGKAEEIGYRNFVNIYPSDVALIETHIANGSGSYNLTLPSTFDAQGFPALDYLLFGLSTDANEQLNTLAQTNYANYLSDLVDRLKALNSEVINDWQNGYRNSFAGNNGSSATASTDKMVNDFLFYYEKFFRAGKVGIPAGVFSGNPMSGAVEAPYSAVYSKELFFEGFNAIKRFFNGEGFGDNTGGNSIKQYLDYVAEANGTENIATLINEQWAIAEELANTLPDNFKEQVETDNLKMLNTYDELQKVVPLLKVDMMQALNIQVDYVDADGD